MNKVNIKIYVAGVKSIFILKKIVHVKPKQGQYWN